MSYEQNMERLVSVIQELSQARTLDVLMGIVKHAARDLTGADGATFVLRDGDKCYYAEEDAISPLWKGQRFPMETCISGWVILNRQPAFIEDIYQDSRIPADAYRPTFVKSLAMVPIRANSPIGAIGNYWAKRHRASEEEIKLLQALANTVSVAMENLELIERLERSNRLFRTFMDHAPFAASVRDSKGKYIFANSKMAELFKTDPCNLIEKNMLEVNINDNICSNVEHALHDDLEVLKTGHPSFQSYSISSDDGSESHLWVTKFSIQQGDSDAVIGTISIDVSERVFAERAREEARAQLQNSYKMAALGEMAGGIAHEVNNPLSIIIGKGRQLCEILDSEPNEVELAKEFAHEIVETSNRIVGIVNGLSTISRHSERDPCISAQLGSIIDGTLAITAAKLKHGNVEFLVNDYDRNLSLECRPPEISQVLLNLLSNAFDAVATLEKKWVALNVQVDNHWITISVTDSGSGIPKDLREKIMAPFFTTKEFGKGTGLGLSITKGIVEAHRGELMIDLDCPNTRFLIRIPTRQSLNEQVNN
ncbi:MAG: ATP-binding protein [Oligoflexus sp.]